MFKEEFKEELRTVNVRLTRTTKRKRKEAPQTQNRENIGGITIFLYKRYAYTFHALC